ncbi:hypothetical protein [Pelagimonas varians]|uniref:Uncharacterized protein n=1 Tax=Pelagimonas varians TaxID=696760 RepID=A0A238K7Y2_9RHOB|nr:hypothetical protein [Pelagimonas varians]PYG31621.1 hypothetical protein C8N36_10438 [Pelagimonas varians]SMX38913.1 hypothetical protein PEV8663_01606 [Pelagimonas varians]
MTQIDELHGRITRALDQISQRVEGYDVPVAVAPEPEVDLEAQSKLAEAEAKLADMAAQFQETSKTLEIAQADAKAAQIEANVAREAAAAEAEKNRFAQDEVESLKEQLAAMPDPEAAAAEVAAPVPEVDTAELDALREELEDEKIANAQLQERLETLTARLSDAAEATQSAVEQQPDAGRDAMAQLEADLQRLQTTNAALEETIAALREANAQGVGEPELINQAMVAELESLRAARAVETAETNTILAAMEPLLAEAANEGGV